MLEFSDSGCIKELLLTDKILVFQKMIVYGLTSNNHLPPRNCTLLLKPKMEQTVHQQIQRISFSLEFV